MKKGVVYNWVIVVALLPFALFMVGYIGTYLFVQQQEFIVPDLIGKSMQEAVVALSEFHVGVSLLTEKEDSRVPAGVVLNQVPGPGSKIRAYKNILVAVSKRPRAIRAPRCLGKSLEEIEKLCKERFLRLKAHYMQSSYPKNCCIVQYPEQDAVIAGNKLVVYISQGRDQLYVFPDFTTILRADVEEFLKKLPVEVDFFEEETTKLRASGGSSCVVEQNPLPGTIFDSSQFMYIQFRVR